MRNFTAFPSLKSVIFFLCFLLGARMSRAQTYLTAIGYPLPTDERGASGVITNAGDYLVLGSNQQHPAGFFNGNGDLQFDWLNSTGTVIQPSKIVGQDVGESANWLEKSVDCNGAPGYIVAGTENNGPAANMLLTATDLAGNPLWVRRFGNPADAETSACVKQDGAGNFILVGTKVLAGSGQSVVYAAKTDCSGKPLWIRTYSTNAALTAASVTAFATMANSCPNVPSVYYITGTSSTAAGLDEVFILSVNTANGSVAWMKTYNIALNAHDAATCIQGSCTLDPKHDGDLWVSGYSTDPNTGDKRLLMLRTDSDGTLIWGNNYNVLNSDQEFITHFQFTNAGDLVLTGKAEAFAISDPPETGQCLLLHMNIDGNVVHWTRVFTLGYASQGNRVEPTATDEYFVSGHTYEIIQPHAFDYNILAIKTNQQGEIDGACFHSPVTEVQKKAPVVTPVTPTVAPQQDFSNASLLVKIFDEKQTFCPPADPCQQIAVNANFSISSSGSTFTFTDLSTVGSGTIFGWNWDFGDSNTATSANPVHTYANPGVYTVCLIVTAGTAGMVCRDTFCQDIKIKDDHLCTDNLLLNGTFTAGLTAGNLGSGGTVSNWSAIFNTPQVITGDSCAEIGAIQMWGDQVVGEGIGQAMPFMAGVTYEVRFCGMWLNTVQDSVRIRFRASVNPLTNYFNCTAGVCDEIFLSPVLSTTWTTYTSAYWTPTQNYNYLNVTLWNNYALNDGAYVSWARIDDICIRRVGGATATQETAPTLSGRVFPNPTDGDLTVEFDEEMPEAALLTVTDLMGRRLQQVPLAAGQVRAELSLRDYPAGVYLVQVLGGGSVLFGRKAVKNWN